MVIIVSLDGKNENYSVREPARSHPTVRKRIFSVLLKQHEKKQFLVASLLGFFLTPDYYKKGGNKECDRRLIGQALNCIRLLRSQFFCVNPALAVLVLTLRFLSDGRQHRNLVWWLGGYR